MITCTTTFPAGELYEKVSLFAQKQYKERLSAVIEARPTFFAFAYSESEVLGCVGVQISQSGRPCMIEGYVENIFSSLAKNKVYFPWECAEIGTRAVQKMEAVRSTDLSIALTATALIQAYCMGVRYVGYTATREVRLISRPLNFGETSFGAPNLSNKDAAFCANWKKFFDLGQTCFGFTMQDTEIYHRVLQRLMQKQIHAII